MHHVLEGMGVVVLACLHAHQTGGDVGAVVRDTLYIVQHIEIDDTGINGAGTLLQTLDVLRTKPLHEDVDDLFQRLHLAGGPGVVELEGVRGEGQYLFQRIVEKLQLLLCLLAEGDFLVGQLLRFFFDVDCIVADALALGDKVEQLSHLMALRVAQLLVCQLDEVVGDVHLHPVDEVLADIDGTHDVLVHLEQQRGGEADVAGCAAGHLDHRVLSLLQSHSRALEQTLIQHRHTQLLRLLRAVRHGHHGQPGQHAAAGQEEQHRNDAGHGVDVCNAALVHHIAPHGDADGELDCIDQRQQDDAADDVEVQVDEGGALAVLGGAADGQQGGEGRADVGAQHDGDGRAEGDEAGAGQRLQDAHRGRRGLDDDRDHHAHENAEDGVGHGDEQLLERCALTQGRHTGVHQAHAREQDAEAQHDLADVLFLRVADEHIKNAADKRHHRRKRLGLDEGQDEAVARNIRHADELTGDRSTNVCTHDNAYRLRKGHDAGVDEADANDDRTGRRLDDAGDEGAENDALDGGRSQFLQYALHLAAGQLFEAGTHDRHTIQEQRNTAQQRGDVCNVHKTMLLKSSYCSIAQDGCASLSIRKMPSFLL